jgi:hypothetical protein
MTQDGGDVENWDVDSAQNSFLFAEGCSLGVNKHAFR